MTATVHSIAEYRLRAAGVRTHSPRRVVLHGRVAPSPVEASCAHCPATIPVRADCWVLTGADGSRSVACLECSPTQRRERFVARKERRK